jgi:hypothetical protein
MIDPVPLPAGLQVPGPAPGTVRKPRQFCYRCACTPCLEVAYPPREVDGRPEYCAADPAPITRETWVVRATIRAIRAILCDPPDSPGVWPWEHPGARELLADVGRRLLT